MADKRAPGSERAAERAAQQNERERIRLAPQTSFANMQVITHNPTCTKSKAQKALSNKGTKLLSLQAFDYEQKKLLATKGKDLVKYYVISSARI